MIRIGPNGAFDTALVQQEIRRLETLARDLRRLLRHGAPLLGDEAAILHDWDYALDQRLCLMSSTQGMIAITDPLVLLDRTRGVARSETAWYRLGQETIEYSRIGRDLH
ncbi:hypothetical protein [Microvirga tunisiensis]|uniref:Uncharacterized protein n=1 Tax=Microvirga tunisiensis TaxID=2108360 RepID=A0A5N7MHJ1_9HYPH|nr:hypothetical protein [Microvirga tunisiensis]MPR07805.1 hypothetical protein [Microvirga tunisiensis]MPR26200.1 hypothetical protein [Microvirga tunisiensis]